jgi:WD40 repeat protein
VTLATLISMSRWGAVHDGTEFVQIHGRPRPASGVEQVMKQDTEGLWIPRKLQAMKPLSCHFALVGIVLLAPNVQGQARRLEPVSLRLKRELIHPTKDALLTQVRFSPDGKQVVAGDGTGVIQLWEAESGKRLTKIENGSQPYRSISFFVSPDWKKLYAARERQNKDGGLLPGDVVVWDLATGGLSEIYTLPDRSIQRMLLSPDGTTLVTFDWLFNADATTTRRTSPWNVQSKKFRLLSGVYRSRSFLEGVFYSPDGKSLAVPVVTENDQSNGFRVFDTATAKIKISITESGKDGRFIQCLGRWLKLWNPATGRELDSFQLSNNDIAFQATFHAAFFLPPLRLLAVSTANKENHKFNLLVFDVSNSKLVKSFIVNMKPFLDLTFSPSGKWIAVPQEELPADMSKREYKIEELAQPRINLMDSATGIVRESLVMPRGYAGSVAFSPDGQTLAACGQGRVLLFDLSTPPEEKK